MVKRIVLDVTTQSCSSHHVGKRINSAEGTWKDWVMIPLLWILGAVVLTAFYLLPAIPVLLALAAGCVAACGYLAKR